MLGIKKIWDFNILVTYIFAIVMQLNYKTDVLKTLHCELLALKRFWQFWFDAAVICCVFYWWCLWFSFETMGSVNTAMQQINLSKETLSFIFWRLWYLLTLGCILQWESWKVIGIPCLYSLRKSVYIHVTCWFMLELFNQRYSFKPALHLGPL